MRNIISFQIYKDSGIIAEYTAEEFHEALDHAAELESTLNDYKINWDTEWNEITITIDLEDND